MNTRIGSLVIATALLGAAAQRPLAGQAPPVKVDPSWMTVKSGDSTVEFRLTAGMTALNGGMNFDGATKGALTVTVPVQWHVTLHFLNDDENMPHSAEVTSVQNPLPATPGKPVFPGAESRNATLGVDAGSKQDVHFTADQAGSYLIVCEVPGHGAAGMWIRLVVSATVTRPEVQATPPTP